MEPFRVIVPELADRTLMLPVQEATVFAFAQPSPELADHGRVFPRVLLHFSNTHHSIPSSASFSTGRASTALLPRTTIGL